jgi:hypothetical protein
LSTPGRHECTRPVLGRSTCLLLALAVATLAGCGSTAVAPIAHQQTPATPKPSSIAANTPGTPTFLVSATGEGGDTVKLEGRIGPPLPSAQSDVNQAALSECPEAAGDGRAVVVRLDVAAGIESSLAGEVGFETSLVRPVRPLDFVLGFNPPTCVLGEPQYASVNLGMLQPHQAASFTMWVVLPDVVTPDDPQPSEQTLREEGWFIELPTLTLNGRVLGVIAGQQPDTSGPRVVACQNNPSGKYIAVIGGTPQVLTEQNVKDYGEVCAAG